MKLTLKTEPRDNDPALELDDYGDDINDLDHWYQIVQAQPIEFRCPFRINMDSMCQFINKILIGLILGIVCFIIYLSSPTSIIPYFTFIILCFKCIVSIQ